jgi:large subunit ribosomal protein L4
MAALKAKVLDGTGKSTGQRDLPEELFGGEINVPLMHQVVHAQLAEARRGTASTKTRSEVRGGGKKPWRQKGTGRARHGSTRSPIWVGGGVVFGPKPRSYSQKVNKKMKAAALRSALADKANEGRIFIIDGFNEAKTKAAASLLKTAEIDGRLLVIVDSADEGSATVDRAFRNLDKAAFSLSGSIGVYDVVVSDAVLFTSGAFDAFTSRFKKEASA